MMTSLFMETRPRKLLDQVRDVIRLKHYSYRTEQSYVNWIHRYILFHNKQHLIDMGVPDIKALQIWFHPFMRFLRSYVKA